MPGDGPLQAAGGEDAPADDDDEESLNDFIVRDHKGDGRLGADGAGPGLAARGYFPEPR